MLTKIRKEIKNEDMRSRKDWSHTRREVEKSLRKYYSAENRQFRLEQEEERVELGIPGEKQKHMTISLKMLWTQFSERYGKV